MRFDWDEAKNRINIRKHGFDFADAWQIFEGPVLTVPETREDYGEDRWIGIGFLQARVVVVVYVERGFDMLRIISLRKAQKHERQQFEDALRNGLGTY
ncbi:MAG: BrnT family toxin [Acidobacteria bacterium]|nr:BrnT family toxin [Acidobacteriota bacterium]MBI3424297.1 BrnT family toxin [Acidobacteriota bacterium]